MPVRYGGGGNDQEAMFAQTEDMYTSGETKVDQEAN